MSAALRPGKRSAATLLYPTPLSTNLALTLLGGLLVYLSWHLRIEFDHFVIGYSETSLCALVTFLGAALLVTRQPVDRWTLPLIVIVAVLCRLGLLIHTPYLSSDVYRYVWDGMVQHHGINPYRYVPGDAHLAYLRDSTVFPNINRRDYAPTIYPPIAQMFFYLATFFGGKLVAMRAAMDLCDGFTIFALVKLLRGLALRREQVLLYAWSPLMIWEIGSSAHLDALMTMFIVLALLFRLRNQPVMAGLALGAAVLTKFYPLLLFPALWQRRDWKMPVAMAAVCLTYLPYLAVGKRVLGFAGGYVQEEGIGSGSRYFLLDWVHHLPSLAGAPIAAFYVFCALCFAGLILWSLRTSEQPGAFLAPAGALAFAMMLFFSPHYPWYVIWLAPFLVLAPSLGMGVYVCAIFYAFTTRWASPGAGMYFLGKYIYGATALALVVQWLWHGWPRGRQFVRSVWPVRECA